MFKKFLDKLTGKDKKEEVVEEIQEELEEIEEENDEDDIFAEPKKEEEAEKNLLEILDEMEDEEVVEEELLEELLEEDVSEIEEEIEEEEEKPKNFFSRLVEGLAKTKKGITEKVDLLIKGYAEIDEDLYEEIEEVLITADVGMTTTLKIVDQLRDNIRAKKITDPAMIKPELRSIIEDILKDEESYLKVDPSPAIVVVVGVNGVGKTTTIGKLAKRYKEQGKNVLLAAGDTFRAAAIDQLQIWADRAGVELVKHNEGADPGAVVFDGIQAAKARNADLLICDTAGRLHNKKNLMNELGKVFKIIEREYPEATKEILLVVDATTGQNAVMQAKVFKEVANITGIALTKLDGTAKGGVVLAVKSELDVPIKLIGVGEKPEDLQDFNAQDFVKALFS